MRTNELRKVIFSQLDSLQSAYPIKKVYYRVVDTKKMYPHLVYDFEGMNLNGLDREDSVLTIDIYDNEVKRIEDIADDIEDLFRCENLPQDAILPTFFLESRRNLPDEDANIRHILLKFTVQNYER